MSWCPTTTLQCLPHCTQMDYPRSLQTLPTHLLTRTPYGETWRATARRVTGMGGGHCAVVPAHLSLHGLARKRLRWHLLRDTATHHLPTPHCLPHLYHLPGLALPAPSHTLCPHTCHTPPYALSGCGFPRTAFWPRHALLKYKLSSSTTQHICAYLHMACGILPTAPIQSVLHRYITYAATHAHCEG